MAEANAVAKKKAEVTKVTLTDGREVEFAGKRKVNKDTLIDESKIIVDGEMITMAPGAVSVRMDFLNGQTRTMPLPLSLIARFAGHGGEQKFGDELAYTPKAGEPPATIDDFVQWIDDLFERVQSGSWNAVREGEGGVAGASIVVKALMEASGKPVEKVKEFLQKKLDDAKARGQKLSRNELYNSFRNPETKVGQIIDRMQKEALSKESKVDADAALGELSAA